MRRSNGIVLSVLCVLFAGCATIVSPLKYPVVVSADVKDVKVTVYNRDKRVDVVTAPAEMQLSPKSGYFSSARYRFVFEKAGYSPDEVILDSKFNGWYVGNLLFGGIIGLLIVDPATGAMWKLNKASVVGSPKPRAPSAGGRKVVPRARKAAHHVEVNHLPL